GVVYDASLTDYGADAPLDYWDGTGGGIPFYAGGTLQAGYGTGWSDGPAESGGSVTLAGTAVADDFDTAGTTDMAIIQSPYSLPSAGLRRALTHGSARRRGRVGRRQARASATPPSNEHP
ncbi:MAG: hypothetical protein ACRDY1_12950, partial [Acidimicrobiales bacterium]